MGSPPWLRPLCEHVAVSTAPVRKSLAAGVDRRVGSRQNLLLDMCVTSRADRGTRSARWRPLRAL